jgi:translation elongation factor EF-1beta
LKKKVTKHNFTIKKKKKKKHIFCFCSDLDLLIVTAKLVPVGYGIKKLTIMLTIVDDLVSVDTLIEEHLTVEPINEYVQSCDIVAFNKICTYCYNHFFSIPMNLCCHLLLGYFVISLSLYALLDFDHRNIVCLIARFGMLISFSLCLILVAELEDVFVCVVTGEVAISQELKTFMHG